MSSLILPAWLLVLALFKNDTNLNTDPFYFSFYLLFDLLQQKIETLKIFVFFYQQQRRTLIENNSSEILCLSQVLIPLFSSSYHLHINVLFVFLLLVLALSLSFQYTIGQYIYYQDAKEHNRDEK